MALYVSQITGAAGRDMAYNPFLVVEVDEGQDTTPWTVFDLDPLQAAVEMGNTAAVLHELALIQAIPCILRADLAAYTFLFDE